jgi:flagellar biosynthetic protein FliQ
MTTEGALDLLRNAMLIGAEVSGPMLLAALAVGLLVGILQTATQVNEASVSFLAKLIAVGLTLIVIGPYMLTQLIDYTQRTLGGLSQVVR